MEVTSYTHIQVQVDVGIIFIELCKGGKDLFVVNEKARVAFTIMRAMISNKSLNLKL